MKPFMKRTRKPNVQTEIGVEFGVENTFKIADYPSINFQTPPLFSRNLKLSNSDNQFIRASVKQFLR